MRRVVGIVTLVLLAGCGADSPAGPSGEIRNYLNTMSGLATEGVAIENRYNSVIGANYTTDAAVQAALVEVIPKTRDYIVKIEAVTPPTKARSLHENYISAWNLEFSAFQLVQLALTNKDAALVIQANDKLAQARALARDVAAQLQTLT